MGFDVTYHPIKEKEIQEWYFDGLKNEDVIEEQSKKYELHDFYKEKYKEIISVGRNTEPSENFDTFHGFFIAVVQGLFRKHFYLRGSAFSFLIENKPMFEKYTKKWKDILSFEIKNPAENRILTNYSSGVFISAEQVEQLLNDYETDEKIRLLLDNFYSDGHISVFLKALQTAKEHNAGLLEATEVVEPNPLDLNQTTSYSNLYNCDPEGAYLYQKVALQQLKDIEQEEGLEEGELLQAKVVAYKKMHREEN